MWISVHIFCWGQGIENPPITCSTLHWSQTISYLNADDKSTVLEQTVYGKRGGSDKFSAEYVIQVGKKKLRPLKVEGLENNRVSYDEYHEGKVRFIYPPLPEGTVEFDWIAENGKGFYGVQVNGEVAKVELPDSVVNRPYSVDYQLPEFAFKNGRTVIEGVLLGYRPEMGLKLTHAWKDWVLYTPVYSEVNVNPDGTFRIEKDILHSQLVQFLIGKQSYQKVFVTPGSYAKVYISLPDMFADCSTLIYEYFGDEMKRIPSSYRKKLWFMGDYADFNTDLERCSDTWEHAFKHLLSTPSDYTCQEYKKEAFTQIYQYRADKINQIEGISKVCRNFLLLDARRETSVRLYRVLLYKDNKNYDFHTDYSEHFIEELLEYEKQNYAYKHIYLCDFSYDNLMYSEKFNIPIEKPAFWEDFKKAKSIGKSLLKSRPLTEEQYDIVESIGDEELKKYLLAKNDSILESVKRMMKKGGCRVRELDVEEKGESILPSILEPFEGKVVLIDFWATWCGPCKRAMKTMLPMKTEFNSKKVAFVYLAEPSSMKSLWEQQINQIPGDHYFITTEQYQYLQEKFKFSGIPFYLVIDRNGNVVYKHVGASELHKIKQAIEHALMKE